ncbi:CHAT domain-containing protein [Streptomyces lucensis]|nr:CHAT domain-containing protein [Streptomyces lucensis]
MGAPGKAAGTGDLAFAMEDLLDAYFADSDPRVLTDPEARRLADRLYYAIDWLSPGGQVADVARRFNAALLLGAYHWYRFRHEEQREDAGRASVMYLMVAKVAPQCVPGPLLDAFTESGSLVRDGEPTAGELAGYTGSAVGLLKEAEVTGDLCLLDDAVQLCLLSARANPRDDLVKAEALTVLGNVLVRRYEFADDADALDRAMVVTVKAGEMTPPDHPYFRTCSSGFGHIAIRTFQRDGDLHTLDLAVRSLRAAAYGAPDDDPHRAAHLTNLATALSLRGQRTGRAEDTEEAFEAQFEAVEITPPGHPDAPSRLINLAGALGTRSGDPAAGEDGRDLVVGLLEDVLPHVPEGHPNRPGCLIFLVHALGERFAHSGDPADLARSVEVGRQALAEGLSGGGYLEPDLLRVFARSLRAYAEHFAAPAALSEAVEVLRGVEQSLPGDHPDRTETLSMLGFALWDRFKAGGRTEDRHRAAEALSEASRVPTAPARSRTLAAAAAGTIAADSGDFARATDLFALALDQLELTAWRGLGRPDRESLISDFPDLVTNAAASAVRAGRPERAVELLEQGRGILLAQALETRADDQALRARAPDLADRLGEILLELDRLPDSPYATASWSAQDRRRANERRGELARRREEILAAIRALPRLAGFLRPPSFTSLREAAEHGPVVLLIASRYGCRALVLTGAGVRALPLGTDHRQVAERTLAFLRAVGPGGSPLAAHTVVVDTLAWLWEAVAEPVLQALGHTGAAGPDADPPRLWWCPTGLFTLFPLHAAERVGPGTGRQAVLDRVVSSYTPTLRALLHAREHSPRPLTPDSGGLVVSMPSTPDLPDLPAAGHEAQLLHLRYPDARLLTGPAATIPAVLEALGHCSWAHFACHGTQDLARPSNGALHLHDGPLTLRDIADLRLPRARFAFLSACETSRGGMVLADEALSLAATLQIAGFRDVVGTLWPIDDGYAREVADLVYENLARPDTPDPAAALHAAIAAVRSRHPDAVLVWAPYAHVGP